MATEDELSTSGIQRELDELREKLRRQPHSKRDVMLKDYSIPL